MPVRVGQLCRWPLGADTASPVGDARAGASVTPHRKPRSEGDPRQNYWCRPRAPRQRLLPDALGFGAAVAAAAAAGAWAAALQLLEAAEPR